MAEDVSSPASTPDSNDQKFLIRVNKKWCDWKHLPVAILSVSFLQIVFHVYSTSALNKVLRFEPSKRLQIWRYLTYMLVHEDWSHLALNVVIQCIFASLLEINQGRLRVLLIYALGGATGVLGAACIHPDLVVGASAGGYALLLSNVADLILNYQTIKYKLYRATSISTLIVFDVIYDIVHVNSKKEPQVSWQAHFFGGLTGLFLGLVIFKCDKPTNLRSIFFMLGLGFYVVFVATVVIMTVQISRCTPWDVARFRYIYFC